MDKIKTLSQNITHLSIYQIKRLNDKSFDNKMFGLIVNNSKRRDLLWNFIKLFKNIKKLKIIVENRFGIERLFSENIPSLESLDVSFDNTLISYLTFDSFMFKTDNISRLKRLNIEDFYIRSEELQTIVNSMNLKSFQCSCIQLDINLLSNLAEKHKQLNELSILWTNFMPYSYVENLIQFENVRHFVLHDSTMNPNHFRQIIGLFPSLVVLQFTPYFRIECGLKEEENFYCETCLGICFDSIPRMNSLKRFVVSFTDMCPALVHCLKGFPQLNRLSIRFMWSDIEKEGSIKRYNLYFRDIIEYLSDKCRQTPTKAFKLFVWEFISIPEQTVIPKNLKIIKHSENNRKI